MGNNRDIFFDIFFFFLLPLLYVRFLRLNRNNNVLLGLVSSVSIIRRGRRQTTRVYARATRLKTII